MNYLVTGGAGFIGSNIARELIQLGQSVRVLDDFSSGCRKNLTGVADRIDLIEGDIRDLETVRAAVDGIDIVLHQAAVPSVPRSVADPVTSNAVNIDGTLNVLEASRQAGVRKLVMASSSSVYGESEELPKHEAMASHPLSPYAITKLTDEHYCRVYWELYRFPTVCLRYFNIFGPHQDPNSEYAAVVPKFITALLAGKTPVVYGDGEQSRDFTYIENCVQANLLAALNDKIVGDVYNVACGNQFTLNQLLNALRKIIGTDTQAQYDPPRPGDIRHSYASVDKLKGCGYNPKVGFEEGLRHTVKFFSAAP
jgi:UDP-glucose 4-epimerase